MNLIFSGSYDNTQLVDCAKFQQNRLMVTKVACSKHIQELQTGIFSVLAFSPWSSLWHNFSKDLAMSTKHFPGRMTSRTTPIHIAKWIHKMIVTALEEIALTELRCTPSNPQPSNCTRGYFPEISP